MWVGHQGWPEGVEDQTPECTGELYGMVYGMLEPAGVLCVRIRSSYDLGTYSMYLCNCLLWAYRAA